MSAAAESLRRWPPLDKPKHSKARPRIPANDSSKVASIASSSALEIAAFLAGRTPQFTDARRARLSTLRIASSWGAAEIRVKTDHRIQKNPLIQLLSE